MSTYDAGVEVTAQDRTDARFLGMDPVGVNTVRWYFGAHGIGALISLTHPWSATELEAAVIMAILEFGLQGKGL